MFVLLVLFCGLDCYMETVLDALAIQQLLPHRYPFLLVDRIVELVPRERIVGIKQVSINEYFFQGHFPGAPVMPGVLIVEALAQVGAILALREIEDRDQKLVLFTGIKEARFRRPVVPGDTLVLEVTALRIGSRVQRMRGEAKVDGQLAADAEIMSIVAPREENRNRSYRVLFVYVYSHSPDEHSSHRSGESGRANRRRLLHWPILHRRR